MLKVEIVIILEGITRRGIRAVSRIIMFLFLILISLCEKSLGCKLLYAFFQYVYYTSVKKLIKENNWTWEDCQFVFQHLFRYVLWMVSGL